MSIVRFNTRLTAGAAAVFAVWACDGPDIPSAAGSAQEPTISTRTADQGTGYAKVTKDGRSWDLAIWPHGCGVSSNANDLMAAKAGVQWGDTPSKMTLMLHIAGDKRRTPWTTIHFSSDVEGEPPASARLTGEDVPWFDGKRFEWSGPSENGGNFSVELECP